MNLSVSSRTVYGAFTKLFAFSVINSLTFFAKTLTI